MEREDPLPLAQDALQAMEIPFERHGEELCLCAQSRRGKVPVVLRCRAGRFALYARLPAQAEPTDMALRCNRLNRTLGDGCLVADEAGRAYLKQTLYYEDELGARWTLEHALARQRALIEQCLGALEL
ncbi:MAG: hypothetical protein ACOX83_01700 [Candidatus Spyradocola sp.]|jgi:hypothetical protein